MADIAPIILLFTCHHKAIGGFAAGKLADRSRQIADRAILAIAADIALKRPIRGIERLLAHNVDDAAWFGAAIEHRRWAGE